MEAAPCRLLPMQRKRPVPKDRPLLPPHGAGPAAPHVPGPVACGGGPGSPAGSRSRRTATGLAGPHEAARMFPASRQDGHGRPGAVPPPIPSAASTACDRSMIRTPVLSRECRRPPRPAPGRCPATCRTKVRVGAQMPRISLHANRRTLCRCAGAGESAPLHSGGGRVGADVPYKEYFWWVSFVGCPGASAAWPLWRSLS